jgi:hypothetical protein
MKTRIIISLGSLLLLSLTRCASLTTILGLGDKLTVRVINIDTDQVIEGINIEITQSSGGEPIKKVSNEDGLTFFPEIKEADFTIRAHREGSYFPFDSSYIKFEKNADLLISLDTLRTIVRGKVCDSLSFNNLMECFISTDSETIEVESDSIGNSLNFVFKSDLFDSKPYNFIANRDGYVQVSKNTAIMIHKNQRNQIPPILMKREYVERETTIIITLPPIFDPLGKVYDGEGGGLDSNQTDTGD